MAEPSAVTSAPIEESTAAAAATNGIANDNHNMESLKDDSGEADLTKAEVDAAGPQATTDVNPPDGKGTAEADVTGAAAAAISDTTPASSKSKRKSSAGVPEHKTKKLNKKKSMQTLNLDLVPGNYVWARLKGYPPWPAICCDEAMLPESLLGSRPVSTRKPDGTYREDFEEGGKNAKDRTYPVMFLSTNEFAWMVNTSLTKLDPSECASTSEKKMQPALKDAYAIAAEGLDLDHFKDLLRQHEQEVQEIEKQEREKAEQKATEAAEKAEKKADKERRKSKAAEDDMDVDEEGKASKKRKKDVESEGEGPKPKKTPKVKLSTKEPKPESAKKTPKAKKTAAKAAEEKAAPELSEEERLARREKAMFYLRHKLQKCFLSNSAPPEDEMPAMADHFTQLEQHKDLEPQIIRQTKIHKVLKNIVRLENIPRDDEFNFKSRSADMLNHWNNALSASSSGEAGDAKATTNGEPRSEEPKTAEEAKKDVQEPADAPVEATDPGNVAADEAADTSMVDASLADTKPDKPVAEEQKDAAEGAKAEVADASKTDAPATDAVTA